MSGLLLCGVGPRTGLAGSGARELSLAFADEIAHRRTLLA